MHHRMDWLVAAGLLLQAPSVTALGAEDGGVSAQAGLLGKRWAWDSFTAADGDGGALVPTHPERYWLEFLPDGKLVLQADCNRGFGTWTEAGGGVQLKPLGTTLMACLGESLDGPFLELLGKTSRFALEGATLLLFGPSGVLRLAEVPAAVLLTQTAWTLVAVEDTAGATPISPGGYRLEFHPGGALQWTADCQKGSGTFVAKGRTLKLQADGAASPTACAAAAPGPDFSRLLYKTARFHLEGTELVLEGAARRLRFRPAP
jgi:heat shock protein HslJ